MITDITQKYVDWWRLNCSLNPDCQTHIFIHTPYPIINDRAYVCSMVSLCQLSAVDDVTEEEFEIMLSEVFANFITKYKNIALYKMQIIKNDLASYESYLKYQKYSIYAQFVDYRTANEEFERRLARK